MRNFAVAFIILVSAQSTVSYAQSPIAIETGGDLARLCATDRKSSEYGMCYSFNAAVLETAMNNAIYGFKICVPRLVKVNNAVDLPSKWLRAHTDRANWPASKVAAEAYAAAFPCKKID